MTTGLRSSAFRRSFESAPGALEKRRARIASEGPIFQQPRAVHEEHGPLDMLANSGGMNIQERSWAQLEPAGMDGVLHGNLKSAFYVAAAMNKVLISRP